MDDKETLHRRARLRELIRECFNGKDADLLDFIQKKTGKRPNQGEMSGLQKDNGSRSFGDKKAKTLTEQIGLNRYWFDMKLGTATNKEDWLALGDIPVDAKNDEDLVFRGFTREPKLLPVAGIAQLGTNGWYDEIEANGTAGYVEHYTGDENAYALCVRGDSMYPAIRNGWYVIVEPSMSLAGGIYVAIALKDGKKMVKELLYETTEEYVLQSVNGNERLSINRNDIHTIHGVSAVVAPGKHRE